MLTIAILNNMPDAAVRSTERQFGELLAAAAGIATVQVRWFAFNPRDGYGSLDDLLALKHIDGLVVTGNEPKMRRVTDEVYWDAFIKVAEWASHHTTSTIWSCLAAHAAVLYIDGIERSALPKKLHGLFTVDKLADHALLTRINAMEVPHSRWHDVNKDDLRAHGYTILTGSEVAGVNADTFIKHVGNSLFVMLQGHLEYDARALMREYRRDALRFISGERDTYPGLPSHYFDSQTEQEMTRLQERALADRSVDVMTEMQTLIGKAGFAATWKSVAREFYHNWLDMLSNTKTTLFPSTARRKQFDDILTDRLAVARDRVNRGSVVPTFDYNSFAQQLETFTFEHARELSEVSSWTIRQLETGLVHITHPRYFGLFNPTPTFPAQCADRIAAVFNPQLATATTSPAAVAIESHVIRSLGRLFGLNDPAGHFTSGGAEANYTALLLALTKASPMFAETGARGFMHHPVFYISHDSHLAWVKIAHQAGIGRNAVRLIDTDGRGRMDAAKLATRIEDDIATGHHPVMIVATAGTTNAGMIDPLSACRGLAKQWDMWLHVDAAWGGAAITSEKHRRCLSGIEDADSITVDAHKWFAATMGCGMLLTGHRSQLDETFQVSTSYMPSNRSNDPYVTSLQWSRRFLGLRLFLSFAVAGWRGYGEHIDRTLRLAERLRRRLLEREWRICNQSPLGVVCIEPRGQSAKEIVMQVLNSGRAWVSVASFEGREVIRACITSGETTESDVDDLVDCLERETH